jgi:hypothetical protein
MVTGSSIRYPGKGRPSPQAQVGATDKSGVPKPRPMLTLLALLLSGLLIVACGGNQDDSGAGESLATAAEAEADQRSDEPAVPGFCADEEGRGQANLLYQFLPQIAASPDGGKGLFENPVFTGPDLDALARHLDAVEAAPAAEADAGGEVKSTYVQAMRNGVDAYSSAKEGDPSKLAAASPAVSDAYLAFATPYACS